MFHPNTICDNGSRHCAGSDTLSANCATDILSPAQKIAFITPRKSISIGRPAPFRLGNSPCKRCHCPSRISLVYRLCLCDTFPHSYWFSCLCGYNKFTQQEFPNRFLRSRIAAPSFRETLPLTYRPFTLACPPERMLTSPAVTSASSTNTTLPSLPALVTVKYRSSPRLKSAVVTLDICERLGIVTPKYG